MNTLRSTVRPQRASALMSVLIFGLVLMLLSGSIVQWSLTERRMNARAAAWLEARNAAEAAAEYGCYLVAQAYSTRVSPTFGSSGTNPVSIPASVATTFFAGSNVDLSVDSSGNLKYVEVKAGNEQRIPTVGYAFLSTNDPNNRFDPMAGRWVQRRDVTVVGKARVNPIGGGAPIDAYVEEKVSVRGAPLLTYAVFYSGNDLEFNETPRMDIYGPVHVNGNLFVGPAGGSPQPLTFHGPVTASGHVFHAWRGDTTTAKEGGSTMSATTAVNFSTDYTGGNSTNMLSGGVWKDSTMGADSGVTGIDNLNTLVDPSQGNATLATAAHNRNVAFSQYASQTWHGLLQTAEMGIQSYNPMGFNEPVAHDNATGLDILATDSRSDDGSIVGTGSGYGHGYGPHSLIEPPLTLAGNATYHDGKYSVEQSKLSRAAGLYIQVTVAGNSTATASFKVYGDPNSATVAGGNATGPNGGLLLSSSVPGNVIQFIPYTKTGSGNTTSVTSGLYDQREATGVNVVQIDMGALKNTLTRMDAGGTGNASLDFVDSSGNRWGNGTSGTYAGYNPNQPNSTGWNGGVYIEVQNSNSNLTAVLLGNAQVSSGNSLLPTGASSPNGADGLTIATNAPVYIVGNFNADGNVTTANTPAQYPDDYPAHTPGPNSTEVPVAIAADAITVLSKAYFGNASLAPTTNPNGTFAENSYTNPAPVVPNNGDVEIAAALITGTVSTTGNSTMANQMYSGGVHNLPRFLENWSSNTNTVAIRGSLVSMYNSRVVTKGWQQAYYSAPVRQWGFDQLFAAGRFPPIIPNVISFRRADFTYITASQYATDTSGM